MRTPILAVPALGWALTLAQDAANTSGKWLTTASRYLFQSQWFNVRQDEIKLPLGEDITYTHIEHPGYVVVVPLRDDGLVVMEQVYRHTVKDTLLECPAGGCDVDQPEIAASRELEEETGYRATSMQHLGRFLGSTGISNEAFDCYLATGLSNDGIVAREITEQLDIELIPFDQLHKTALAGGIVDGPSTLAILLAWRAYDDVNVNDDAGCDASIDVNNNTARSS